MKVAIAVNDIKTVDRIIAGALKFGVSDRDEIAVITVIHGTDGLLWSILPSPLVAVIEDEADEDARISLREAGQFLRSELHSAKVAEFKLEGKLPEELFYFLNTWQADLLIIGFSENPPWADHTTKIVTSAPCPVLIVGRHNHDDEKSTNHKWWHEPSYII